MARSLRRTHIVRRDPEFAETTPSTPDSIELRGILTARPSSAMTFGREQLWAGSDNETVVGCPESHAYMFFSDRQQAHKERPSDIMVSRAYRSGHGQK
jgi:hypothetical protein